MGSYTMNGQSQHNICVFNKGHFTGEETEKFVYIAGEKRGQIGPKVYLSIHKFGKPLETIKMIETNLFFQSCYGLNIMTQNFVSPDRKCSS